MITIIFFIHDKTAASSRLSERENLLLRSYKSIIAIKSARLIKGNIIQ